MGRTKLHPDQIDEFVRGLEEDRFGEGKFDAFGNNCNHCAKAILKHTLSPENAPSGQSARKLKSRYNRLSNILRRTPKFMQNKLGK